MTANSQWADAYRGRRVLLVGATGFIGRWVARSLTAVGAELWLTARDTDRLAAVCQTYEIGGQWFSADLAKPGNFAGLYHRVQPDVTFNLVGYGVDPSEQDEALATRLNADLVREIAEVIASAQDSNWPGLRLIHVGTAAEYGRVGGPLTEGSVTAPLNLYGRTKLEGTLALAAARRRTRLRCVAARLFMVYGSGEHAGRLLPSLLAAAKSGTNLALTRGTQRRDFTYVGDVAEGLLRLGVLSQVPETINLATGRLTSVRAFVERAAELLGLRTDQLQFGTLPDRQDEVSHGPVDTRPLRQLLDWVPACSIREGIQHTVNFEAHLSGVGR